VRCQRAAAPGDTWRAPADNRAAPPPRAGGLAGSSFPGLSRPLGLPRALATAAAQPITDKAS
ncbi:MAG TPA: hypothetical protein PLF43_12890, partial [Accumulibacter sp.]|nr:hypothetical protein [Accumulibacter sp.]